MSARHICFFSGKRGGFSHLLRLMEAVRDSGDMEHSLIVSDMHLSERFGRTIDEVRAALGSDERIYPVRTLVEGDTKAGRSKSIGLGLMGVTRVLERLAPDFMVVLGDRGEILAPAIAAVELNIPLVHLFGGDLTQGGVDEQVRHAVTKLANIHFAATEESAERIRKMGEEPWRVHAVGSPVLDLVRQGRFTPAAEVRAKYGLGDEPVAILLQHSVTWQVDEAREQIRATIQALTSAMDERGLQVVAVYPCSDPGWSVVVEELERFAEKPGVQLHKNLPFQDFWGLLDTASVLVGNSSCGILEAPSFGLPCVNVGMRQQDRTRGDNVIDVAHEAGAIRAGLDKALDDQEFLRTVALRRSPYGDGRAGERMLKVLRETPLDDRLLFKKMTY